VLHRAAQARYPRSALRDLPEPWREIAFSPEDDELVLLPRFRHGVKFAHHDIRSGPRDGPFDLVLCRYLAFTYFDETGQRDMARALASVIEPGGALVLGNREKPPSDEPDFMDWKARLRVFRRCAALEAVPESAPSADR
jgi:chemotaxis protein methyltransferase CheR